MSVTITKEVEKAETLASGLKAHLDEVKKIGITEEDITKLEQTCAILRLKDEETGALRMELANKVRANSHFVTQLFYSNAPICNIATSFGVRKRYLPRATFFLVSPAKETRSNLVTR